MAKVTASASINPPIPLGIRFACDTGVILLGNRDTALHLRMYRAVVGVGPGFGKCGCERKPGALQARLETSVVGRHAVLVSLVLPGPGDRLAGLHRHGVGLVGAL